MAKMRLATRSAGRCNPESRVVKDLASVHYGTAILAMVVIIGLSNLGAGDAVQAMYVFGDSFDDNGNIPATFRPKPWTFPYGISWPGHPTGRWSDGHNQADCFAELFGLPSPTPYLFVKNDSSTPHENGVNFGLSGAGVTFAFGTTPLDGQVDQMEALVETGVVIKDHLKKSVTLINFGVNDYDARNLEAPSFQVKYSTYYPSVKSLFLGKYQSDCALTVLKTSVYFGSRELETTVATVVTGIALNIVRLHGLGLRNFVVTNLPLLACTPDAELEGMYKSCSTNSTLLNETSSHTLLLQERVRLLNRVLPGLHVVIADQTKAFEELFQHGFDYGFVDPLTPCCHGNSSDLYSLDCGSTNTDGNPIYTLCQDPSKAVLWDTIHPTQAAWRAAVNLFFNVPGYTLEGPMLTTWIKKYNI